MADKSELTDSLLYGIDLKNRRIYFGAPLEQHNSEEDFCAFTQASVELVIRSLHKMAQEAPNKPVEIHMSSYGGEMGSMFRLVDEILSCPCQVKFYGGGVIMSAATWVMVVCDERYLQPHTSVLVHELSGASDGKLTDMKIDAAMSQIWMNKAYELYAANTRMPKEFWQDVCQRDLCMDASEAVSLGMADKILEPKKRGNLRKTRQAAMKKGPTKGEMQKLVDSLYTRINKTNVPKLELNPVVKELADPTVIVENEKAPELVAPAPKEEPKV